MNNGKGDHQSQYSPGSMYVDFVDVTNAIATTSDQSVTVSCVGLPLTSSFLLELEYSLIPEVL